MPFEQTSPVPVPICCKTASGFYQRMKVAACKQHKHTLEVLLKPTIDGIAKITLHLEKTKRVLRLAANGRPAALDETFPILSAIVLHTMKLSRAAVDPIVNDRQMPVCNDFRSLFNARIVQLWTLCLKLTLGRN